MLACLAVLIASALALCAPAAAHEEGVAAIAPTCHAFSPAGTTYVQLAADPDAWICNSTHWKDSQPAGWLRFDASAWQGKELPLTLVTRVTKFDRLSILAVDADGTARALNFSPEQVTPRAGRSVFSAPLPRVSANTVAVVVRFERPWNAAVLSDARLSAEAGAGNWPIAVMVGFGMLAGLLFAPLIFDIALYSVLRQRFILWHVTMVLAMIGYVTSFSGLIVLFTDLGVVTLAKINGFTPALAVGLAGFFLADFLEPDALSKRMRLAVRVASLLVILGPGLITLHPPFLDYRSHQFYFIGYLPALLLQLAAMAQALRRRSRSVKFLIAAWTPIILCGVERIARGVGLYGAPELVDELIYAALVVEVIISAVGVADRMMGLRDQRDTARTRAQVLETLADHDPLTGLLNRRAIEPRFHQLCEHGFGTYALLDLDHFKAINDLHGHAMGDEVLRATARSLAPDEDTLVMRLGGEEFLLLLRGPDARARAEQRRQMLPLRIAEEVPGLSRLVTASMGVVEGPPEAMGASSFRALYSRADKLLYEAKQAGRNRTIGEKLTLFDAHGKDRRGGDRRRQDRRMDERTTERSKSA
ncbi:diguanylate cyclase [Altererythrobacter fulvus]|uniref:sensor domain-containing diguanylate cyclase n=1 Tax=Caenibius fulvus TaxID=2126012 RepID=UPI003019E0B8